MFVRTRTYRSRVDGSETEHHQIVESYRNEAGQPRHRVLVSWTGPRDLTEAAATCREAASREEKARASWAAKPVNRYPQRRVCVYGRWSHKYVEKKLASAARRRDDMNAKADALERAAACQRA